MRRRVADKRDAVDEIPHAFLHVHRHVDDRRQGRGQRFRDFLARFRIVAELELRESGEFPVAGAAVDLARLLEALAQILFVVPRAFVQLEERLQELRFDDGVAGDFDVAHLVARALGDRHAQLDVPRLLVFRVAEKLLLRRADVRADVTVLLVVSGNLVRVLIELRFRECATARDERQEPHFLVVLHLPLQRPGAHHLVAGEDDVPDFDLGAFRHVEGQMDDLRAAGQRHDLGSDLRVLEALLLEHVADDAGDFPHERGVDEGVEADLRHQILQPLVHLRDFDFLRADVVDDLHALPFFDVVRDQLADDAVREAVFLLLDPEILQEVRAPQSREVLVDFLLGRFVPRRPLPLRRQARWQMDVIKVGLGLDDCGAALLFEAGRDLVEDWPRARRGQHFRPVRAPRRRRHVLAADACREFGPGGLGRRSRRLLRQYRRGPQHDQAQKRLYTREHQGESLPTFRRRLGPGGRNAFLIPYTSLRPAVSSPAGRYESWPASRYTSMSPSRRWPRMSASESGSST